MTFGKTSEQQAKQFIIPLVAYTFMADRFLGYFGWSTEQWNVVRQGALEFWINRAAQGISKTQDANVDDPRPGNTARSE